LPSHDNVLQAFNKEETIRLAASLGVAVPKTTVLGNVQQAREEARAAKFPVVLKPRSSVEEQSGGRMQTTGRPRYARNAEELQALYLQMSRTCSRILLQEFVDGEGTGYFALMHHGELRAESDRLR
jgi:predicted ATP-grasp superfamily ATP-dependent carboligase